MEIYQNSDMLYDIPITTDGQPLLASDVEKIEFTFGSIVKVFPESEDITAKENGVYQVRLKQEETCGCEKKIAVQIRVKTLEGRVIPSKIQYVWVNDCLSKEVL